MDVVGHRTHSLRVLLEGLYALESLPNEPWVHQCVRTGLSDPDPDLRELALSIIATGEPHTWTPVLFNYLRQETKPWLYRYARMVLDDYRQLCRLGI